MVDLKGAWEDVDSEAATTAPTTAPHSTRTRMGLRPPAGNPDDPVLVALVLFPLQHGDVLGDPN